MLAFKAESFWIEFAIVETLQSWNQVW